MPRKPTRWTESAMWSGLRLLGEPIGNGFTMRRLEAVAPGWPDIVSSRRHHQQACLIELKVLPVTAYANLGPLGDRWDMVGAWRIPFREAQPQFLRGWAADGGRAIVLCDLQHPDPRDDKTTTLVYVAKAAPEWLKSVQQVTPRPDAVFTRASKYQWPLSVVRNLLYPVTPT